MSTLKKNLSTAIVSIALCFPVVSVFANSFENNDHNMHQGNGPSHNQGNPAQTPAQRLAQLHEKLGVTAAQETAWSTFVTALTSSATQQKPTPDAFQGLSAPDRMDKMVAILTTRKTDLENKAAAVRAFYGVLTPAQQQIFDAQFNMQRRGGRGKHGAW